MDRVLGGLRVLNRIADSPLVERLGLEERAQQLVYEGAKRAAETAAKAAKRLTPKRSGDRPRTSMKFDLSLSGAMAMAVPEALGGAAEHVSAVSQMLIVEDLARGDMGLAYAALSPLSFVNAIVHWGDDHQRASLLPSFLEGDTTAASVAVVEPQPLFDPGEPRTTAKKRGSDYALSGEKSMVALADHAKWFLVAAEIPKAGPRFFLVESDAAGVEVMEEPAMGLRSARLGRLKLDKVHVTRESVLGGEAALKAEGKAAYEDAVNRARIAWGAMALGTSQALLDY
ncbi:MAG: acyl-CoA dehydrogenase family protein, partial [Deltaproteobacteria bacterium]|nr:acyl-CoA dehydrogenase family protein [Deltaproteobacteria bacterium]